MTDPTVPTPPPYPPNNPPPTPSETIPQQVWDHIVAALETQLGPAGALVASVLVALSGGAKEAERITTLNDMYLRGDTAGLQTWRTDKPPHPNYSVSYATWLMSLPPAKPLPAAA